MVDNVQNNDRYAWLTNTLAQLPISADGTHVGMITYGQTLNYYPFSGNKALVLERTRTIIRTGGTPNIQAVFDATPDFFSVEFFARSNREDVAVFLVGTLPVSATGRQAAIQASNALKQRGATVFVLAEVPAGLSGTIEALASTGDRTFAFNFLSTNSARLSYVTGKILEVVCSIPTDPPGVTDPPIIDRGRL